MIELVTSAPGKVVLSGEYAVLDGAPAVAMAINRRARVKIRAANGDSHVIESPGRAQARFSLAGNSLRFATGEDDYRLFEAAWDESAPDFQRNRSFTLTTSEFVDSTSGAKLGIGSSAALMVALCTALCPPSTGKELVAAVAGSAHRRFQDDVGSGVDIAASCFGGILEFRIGAPVRTQMSWPDNLHYALLWSGVSASTRDKVQQLRGQEKSAAHNVLGDAAERVACAWRMADSSVLFTEYQTYVEALRHFDLDHDIGVFDAGHDTLADDARQFDVVYKPCGAGGGDIGIVLGTDADAVAAFAGKAVRDGFMHLDTRIDLRGAIRLEAT